MPALNLSGGLAWGHLTRPSLRCSSVAMACGDPSFVCITHSAMRERDVCSTPPHLLEGHLPRPRPDYVLIIPSYNRRRALAPLFPEGPPHPPLPPPHELEEPPHCDELDATASVLVQPRALRPAHKRAMDSLMPRRLYLVM